MGETVGVGAGAGPGAGAGLGAAAGAEKGVVAVGTDLAAGAAGPEGEETPWDGDAKEGADVTGTIAGASGVGKVEETESEATGSLLPQFPQKACPSLASLPQFRQNIRIPFMRFLGQTRSAPSRASERWLWHSLVFALALRKRLRPPENRAFLAPASAEASRF